MEDEMHEFYLEVKHETFEGIIDEGALLCTDGVNEFWLPKSIIEWEHIKDNDYKIEVPEWKAIEEGLM